MLQVAGGEIIDRGGSSAGVTLRHRIGAAVYLPPEFRSPLAGSAHVPCRVLADRDTPLAAAGPVVQHERPGTGAGDAHAEPRQVGIILYAVAGRRRRQVLYDPVRQPICHRTDPVSALCPHAGGFFCPGVSRITSGRIVTCCIFRLPTISEARDTVRHGGRGKLLILGPRVRVPPGSPVMPTQPACTQTHSPSRHSRPPPSWPGLSWLVPGIHDFVAHRAARSLHVTPGKHRPDESFSIRSGITQAACFIFTNHTGTTENSLPARTAISSQFGRNSCGRRAC